METVSECTLRVGVLSIWGLVGDEEQFACEGFKHKGGKRAKLIAREIGREENRKNGIGMMELIARA
jgi:hypothetical protein